MTRPWLQERFCHDPNPHRPHPWPYDVDEDARYFCRGVDEVPVKGALLGDPPRHRRIIQNAAVMNRAEALEWVAEELAREDYRSRQEG